MADLDVAKEDQVKNENDSQDVAKRLYAQNAELAIRNKTLSLLRKLYQFSIQNFEPEVIAHNITEAIQKDLSYELVGVLVFDQAKNELAPLKFARSERLADARRAATDIPFKTTIIPHPLENPVLRVVLEEKSMVNLPGLSQIWEGIFPTETLKRIESSANVKTALIYPLAIEDKVIGVLILCLNHDYGTLSKFEKESIESFVEVIAVSVDRALLYQELKAANIKLKELDELKSQFLSFASHQVKSPMGVVKGFAEIIRDGQYGEVPPKVKETAEKIVISANKLIDLVNNLLDMRKIEEGKMNYTMEEAELVKMAKEVVEELKLPAENKSLDLIFDSALKEAKIKVDAQKFKQVVVNLVDNAIKYTEKGFVKVSIYEDGEMPGNVVLKVSDSGYGISAALLPNLFKQFSRDPKVPKQIRGTGLGLFIAKKIVNDHGGEIWVESEGEGKGSSFYISIKKL